MNNKILKLKSSNLKNSIINLPGSKSISNRVLLLSSLGEGSITINNLLISDDTKVMIDALKSLGVKIAVNESLKNCNLQGSNNYFLNKKVDIFIGNSGITIRPLTAVLAFNNGEYYLHGTDRMHERPINHLVDSLVSVGADIEYKKNIGFPPIKINPSNIKNNKIFIKGDTSSQFITSILISSPFFIKNEPLEIIVEGEIISKPYIEITIKLMKVFGINVRHSNYNNFIISKKQKYSNPKDIYIEGDASSASYFLAAGAISGKKIRVNGVGSKSIQGDIRFIDALINMGVKINTGENWIEVNSNSKILPIDADFNHIPDAAMTIAIISMYAEGTSILRNIASWKVKETDRIDAMSRELKKIGAKINQGDDFIEITPPKKFSDATIDTYDDHRMAMCFSLLSINNQFKQGANITINDPDCVSKTFPDYFDVFNTILE